MMIEVIGLYLKNAMFLGGGLILIVSPGPPALTNGGPPGGGGNLIRGDIPLILTGAAMCPPPIMNIGLSGGLALGPDMKTGGEEDAGAGSWTSSSPTEVTDSTLDFSN